MLVVITQLGHERLAVYDWAGFNFHLLKPVSPDALSELFEQIQ
jgi:hypothetical protein